MPPPRDPNWEALPRVSRLSGCVISGINTAVFVSLRSAPDRAAARPAACSWSLAPWAPRHQGAEKTPLPIATGCCHPGRSVWRPTWGPSGSWRGDHGGAGVPVPGGDASAQKPPGLFPLEQGWSQLAGQSRVVSLVKSMCLQPGP